MPEPHLRIEEARLYLGAVTCSCGEADCTRWHEDAVRALNLEHSPSARVAMRRSQRQRRQREGLARA